nr:hypothetical protein [Fodinicola acaciae]
MFLDAPHHLPEDWPLGDGLSGVAGLDVFVNDDCAKLASALDADLALGVDRVAVRVNIGVSIHLPL